MAGAFSLVHAIERLHILLCDRKIEDIKILCKALRIFRLRNGKDALLDVPAEQQLGWRFEILFRNFRNHFSEFPPQQRRPRHDLNSMRITERQEFRVVQ